MTIARQPHRYSGRTAMRANVDIHEEKPPQDHDSPFSFSMEGYQGRPSPDLIQRFWAPQWNSVQSVNKFQAEIGGQLVGGDPGRRLIEPAQEDKMVYFKGIPLPFQPAGPEWLVIPAYHVFGSEELSASAPAVAERVTEQYLGISTDDANSIDVSEGEEVKVVLDGTSHFVPVRLSGTLPPRVLMFPAGLAGIEYIDLPCRATFEREESGDRLMVLNRVKHE